MGNRAILVSKVGIISILLVAALQPMFVHAGSRDGNVTDQLTKRLCDRQERLGGRLPRALIDPALCSETPPQTPALTFTATPSAITAGQSATLAWNASNVSSCTASVGWSGTKSLSGTLAVTPAQTTTYELSCTGSHGSVSKQVVVTVSPVTQPEPTLTFTASPASVTSGATSTLSWTSTNTTSCTASNGWSGAKTLSGTAGVAPSATTTYQLDCTGAGGSISRTVTVNVVVPPLTPSLTFAASPASIPLGATSTLTWTSLNTTSCVGGDGAKPTSGTAVVAPTTTTTYVLDCTGPGGTAHASTTVTVTNAPTPTVTLIAAPSNVTPGQGSATTTLTWTSTNVTSCNGAGGTWTGAKSLNNSEVVTPTATTTYVITCTGLGGVVAATTTVNFVPAPVVQPLLTFAAQPLTVTPGAGSATSTLTWNTNNVTHCVSSNGWTGERGLSGTLIVQPLATTTYQLTCGGVNGTTTASVTIAFVPTPVEGKLLITEVLYDLTTSTTTPQGQETANEWVEIYNGTNSAVNLAGWYIGDASTTDALPSVSIPAGKFALITGSSTTASFWSLPADTVVIVLSNPTIGNGLGNNGDGIRLIDTASTTVDTVNWGFETGSFSPSVNPSPTGDDFPGQSIGRINKAVDTNAAADWQRNTSPNPGL